MHATGTLTGSIPIDCKGFATWIVDLCPIVSVPIFRQ